MPIQTNDDISADAAGKWVRHTQVNIAPRQIGQMTMAKRLRMNRTAAENRRRHGALRELTGGCRREENDSRSLAA